VRLAYLQERTSGLRGYVAVFPNLNLKYSFDKQILENEISTLHNLKLINTKEHITCAGSNTYPVCGRYKFLVGPAPGGPFNRASMTRLLRT